LSRSSTEGAAAPPEEARLLEIGYALRPHGLSGEVVVRLLTNRPDRLSPGSRLLARSGGDERWLTVAAARAHQQRHLVSFEELEGRTGAESVRGAVLLAEEVDDPDSLFVHDLIGCEVVEVGGARHGRVASVQENPASDLLVGEEGWLVPARFVVGREPGIIVVDAPDGLFE
jgi:16S rRNA processing protein RimM